MTPELREHMALMAELDRLRVENAVLRRKAKERDMMERMGEQMLRFQSLQNIDPGAYAQAPWGLANSPNSMAGIGQVLFGVRLR